MAKDHYNTLDIDRNATDADIKAAYKKLAKKYHPDVSKEENAAEKFKEVLDAYNVLSDSQRKSNYDRFGDSAERFGGFGGFQGFGAGADFDFGDLFGGFGGMGGIGDLFKGFTGQRGPERGANIRHDLNISFEDAVFGAKKEIMVQRLEECGNCNGHGGTGITKCPTCHGSGTETKTRRTIIGVLQTRGTCSKCGGRGETIKELCNRCNGKARVVARRKIEIKIPAGINTGNHLRLHGEGSAGEPGAANGDLFVVIFVEPHAIFKRSGADIFAELPISFAEATLGAEINAPTLKETVKLKVPTGTQTNTVFKLRGRGVNDLETARTGDEYIKVIVKTPEKINREQRELFEQLSKLEGMEKERKGFFDRIKKHFK